MKTSCVIHILLFMLFMLVYQCASAQDYIITNRGDSLIGEVKPLVYGADKKVQIISPDRKKTTLTLFEVRSFTDDGEVFHPVKMQEGYAFMKLLKEGYLSLYAFQPENQSRFDGLFLLKRDGSSLEVPNLGFKKFMAQFLADCEMVSGRIKEGDFSKKDLTAIVDAYNACVTTRTVDHNKVIAQEKVQTSKISAWETLEESIRSKDFPEKSDALEMIAEVRRKIKQQEKIPNFLLEGLKNSLRETGLSEQFETAVNDLKQ